jgi:hypothetical protein
MAIATLRLRDMRFLLGLDDTPVSLDVHTGIRASLVQTVNPAPGNAVEGAHDIV